MQTEAPEASILNLDALADLLAPRIMERLPKPAATPADALDATMQWLTTKMAARRWNLKEKYLENLRISGSGPPFVKVGNIVRYSSVAGDLWLAQRTRRSTAGGPLAEVKRIGAKERRDGAR